MTLALVGFGYDSKDIGNKRGNRKVELYWGGGDECMYKDRQYR